jgi:hypothetical protein
MIVAPVKNEFPNVWSPWWWVLTTWRTGADVTVAIRSR